MRMKTTSGAGAAGLTYLWKAFRLGAPADKEKGGGGSGGGSGGGDGGGDDDDEEPSPKLLAAIEKMVNKSLSGGLHRITKTLEGKFNERLGVVEEAVKAKEDTDAGVDAEPKGGKGGTPSAEVVQLNKKLADLQKRLDESDKKTKEADEKRAAAEEAARRKDDRAHLQGLLLEVGLKKETVGIALDHLYETSKAIRRGEDGKLAWYGEGDEAQALRDDKGKPAGGFATWISTTGSHFMPAKAAGGSGGGKTDKGGGGGKDGVEMSDTDLVQGLFGSRP